MKQLSPSILSADFSNLLEDINTTYSAGAHLLHVDVMDGHFVPNISIGSVILESLKGKTDIPFDVHLMIENPDQYIQNFVYENTEYITVHAEACKHLHRTIQHIKSFGVKAGVSLNPGTPISVLDCVLEDLDMVLIMTVNPGFSGQKFIESGLDKIKDLKAKIEEKELKTVIEVDGGVKLDNVQAVLDAGADIIVAGSAVFSSDDIEDATRKFVEILKK